MYIEVTQAICNNTFQIRRYDKIDYPYMTENYF